PPPRRFNPEISEGLERILMKALAREPEDRYQWASELCEDLSRQLLEEGHRYDRAQLSSFMKETFAEEILREGEKMERFHAVERPAEIEESNIALLGGLKGAIRKPTHGQMPAVQVPRTGGSRELPKPPSVEAAPAGSDLTEPPRPPP